jgi:hypothetical protein
MPSRNGRVTRVGWPCQALDPVKVTYETSNLPPSLTLLHFFYILSLRASQGLDTTVQDYFWGLKSIRTIDWA